MRAKFELPRFPKVDKRLLGTWKSDKRRTFFEWNWKKNTPPRKKAKLKSFFGKLEITYTRTKSISALRHRKWEQARRYAVVAADETSVAVVKFGKLEIKNRRRYDPENLKLAEEMFPPTPAITHIHFDKRHFWISSGQRQESRIFPKDSQQQIISQ